MFPRVHRLIVINMFQPPPDSPVFGGLKLKLKKEKFKTIFTLGTTLKGFRRATHTVGTGGIGEITIVNDPKFPEHEFFTAGSLVHSAVQLFLVYKFPHLI